MSPIKIAIVGVGKIVQDQHAPVLRADPDFEIVAAASPNSKLEGTPTYPTVDAMLAAHPEIEAVAVCTPPQIRHDIARQALLAGKHVLLEKPPGATVSEVTSLADLAAEKKLSLFATWHSRHAAGVEPARAWVSARKLKSVEVVWREDVRRWHPGQAWIWKAGGLGVFDPGINALSIVTRILPPFFLREAELSFPSNCEAPIAAKLSGVVEGGAAFSADFDWRQTGPQTWDVRIQAEDGGSLRLSLGGEHMEIDGQAVDTPKQSEYASIYRRFSELVRGGHSDVDVRPLQQAADAFLLGRRIAVEAFIE
jgi:D-galactose 1-dehydrogenase